MGTDHTNFAITSLVLFCFTICSLSSVAQVDVIEDDPYATNLVLQLKLADFECGMSDILRLGVGFRGDYFLPKVASFSAGWHQAIFSTLVSSDAEIMENENADLSQFRMLEAGGRLHILDRKGTIKSKGYMGSEGVYSYYAKMEGIPIRKIFALRGGVYTTTVPVSSQWSTLDNGIAGGIVASDGNIIGTYTELFTNMRTTGMYAGISSAQFANVKYNSHGRTWVSKFFKEVYFDVLYAPSVTFDPFVTTDAMSGNQVKHTIEPNMEGSIKTSNIGWRVGMYRVRSKTKVNVMFGLEAGARPGVFFKGGYFASSVALSFSS